MTILSPSSLASSSSETASGLQGAHHSVQKSTKTGFDEAKTSR
jgi:hypothetical protein